MDAPLLSESGVTHTIRIDWKFGIDLQGLRWCPLYRDDISFGMYALAGAAGWPGAPGICSWPSRHSGAGATRIAADGDPPSSKAFVTATRTVPWCTCGFAHQRSGPSAECGASRRGFSSIANCTESNCGIGRFSTLRKQVRM